MPILVIEDEIEHLKSFNSIPLVCVQCGFQMSLPQPNRQILYALYDATSLQSLKHELVMLQRTQALFDRFPNSRHPQKMCKEFVSKEERPKMEADPEFDVVLDADPELRSFLRQRSFWLPGRLESVKEIIEREEQRGRARLKCSNCTEGHFCIEPTFAQRVLFL